MDQLHEELKYPVVTSDEEGDDDDEDDQDHVQENGSVSPSDPGAQSLAGSLGGGGDCRGVMGHDRQNSIDSSSSECEYETCDSGLSSEMGSQADPTVSSEDNNSDVNEQSVCLPSAVDNADKNQHRASPNRLSPAAQRRLQNKNRNSHSAGSENVDTVANLKEIKETANLLSKIETDNARNQELQKSESGEYLDALSDSAPAANTRSKTAAAAQQLQQQQHQQQRHRQEMASIRPLPSVAQPTLLPKSGYSVLCLGGWLDGLFGICFCLVRNELFVCVCECVHASSLCDF